MYVWRVLKTLPFRYGQHFFSQSRSLHRKESSLFDNRTSEFLNKVEKDESKSSFLETLKSANITDVSSSDENQQGRIQAITLSNGMKFDGGKEFMGNTLFVRDFYPRLFNCIMETDAILTGNPGISKSWFQWYIIYRLVKDSNYNVIVRQVGDQRIDFLFPQHLKVCTGSWTDLRNVFREFNPHEAFYLYEPESSLLEPIQSDLQTVITCSPDRRRYHEFNKRGAARFYMPVWKLSELQSVGKYVCCHLDSSNELIPELAPNKIEQRYKRFGGIFRYVLPSNKFAIEEAENNQESVLALTKVQDVFAPGISIEKADHNKQSISDFILQYKVHYGEEYETEFKDFEMVIASEYVDQKLSNRVINSTELYKCIQSLKQMFLGVRREYLLFEFVVFHLLLEDNNWEIFDGKKWDKRRFRFNESVRVPKDSEHVLKTMQPGTLYYPLNPHFPIADFLFVESGEVFGVQVTFAKSHAKEMKTFENLFELLDLNEERKLHLFLVPNPRHLEQYVKYEPKNFITKASQVKQNRVDFSIIRNELLDPTVKRESSRVGRF